MIQFPSIRTVLVADDSTFARTVCIHALKGAGVPDDAEFIEAQDGHEALALLKEMAVDLVISDLNMPVLDGRALAAALDVEPALRSVPLVVASAVSSRLDAATLRRGPVAVVAKPVAAPRLAKAIAEVLALDVSTISFDEISDAMLGAAPGHDRIAELARTVSLCQGPAPDRLRVLVVDDSASVRKIVSRVVQSLGCEVDTAEHGRQALHRMAEARYSLVVMDCDMPQLDGISTTKVIRAVESKQARTCIVAHTAAAEQSVCLDAGMDGFFSKDISLPKLRDGLREWTGRVRGAA